MRLEIASDRIPITAGIEAAGLDPLRAALGSGEEFELLAASPTPLSGGIRIGEVREGCGVYLDGITLEPTGFTHAW